MAVRAPLPATQHGDDSWAGLEKSERSTGLVTHLVRDEGVAGSAQHQLKGDRAGTWSISVSGNWRLTFDIREGEMCNLDLEDYH